MLMSESQILDALALVDRPGTFCSQGSTPFVMPGLNVHDVGWIGFPTPKSQTEELISQCEQAPYGKGLETVVDTEVRRVWELSPSKFNLEGPSWDHTLSEIISNVTEELGIQGGTLVPDLYKLLVYGPGDFFLPHRDGEKLDGMVATLTVVLPSLHRGGSLVVTHGGERVLFQAPEASAGMAIDYCAFYADCEHEVKPLTEGYRICLTYNLAFVPSDRRKKVQLKAPDLATPTDALVKAIESEPFPQGQVVISLEHQYSEVALKPELLKGADKMRYHALRAASEKTGCHCYLTLLTWYESGSAYSDDDGYEDYYSRSRYRSRSRSSSTNYEMEEVFEESWTLEHWIDADGQKANMGKIHVERENILSIIPIEDWEPSDEEFEGYTGNAGMTLDRWYHRAAIVICPKGNEMDIFLTEGTDAAIGGLEQWVKRWKNASKSERETAFQDTISMAQKVMERWQCRETMGYGSDRAIFSDSLKALQSTELISNYVEHILSKDMGAVPSQSFLKFLKTKCLSACEKSVLSMFKLTQLESFIRNIKILHGLATVSPTKDAHSDLLLHGSKYMRLFLKKDTKACHRLKAEDLVLWIEALMDMNAPKELELLLKWIDKNTSIEQLHIPSLLKLKMPKSLKHACNSTLALWLESKVKHLEQKTAQAPQPYKDWTRSPAKCTCELCQRLNRFLVSPHQSSYEYKAKESDRSHIQGRVSAERLDLVGHTVRKGSPHALVLEKNSASYERACEVHQQDLKKLKALTLKLSK